MPITVVYDATHDNISHLPANASYAGYATGSGGVGWTTEDFIKFPDAIRIDQSPAPGIWDSEADIDDFEKGAVEISELAPRAKVRQAAFKAGTRKGQRMPGVYASASNITAVANALIGGGVKSGVGLWVANWDLTEATAIQEVTEAAGPFPIIGVQFHNAGTFDISVFSTSWLTERSGAIVAPPATKTAVPPGQWDNAAAWTWKQAILTGIGTDGNEHAFRFDVTKNQWVKLT